MANAKEIRTQIKSIQNTQKITRAMEMVAASKMRRAQDRMEAARPYADKMRGVIGNLADASSDVSHPYLKERSEVKSVGIIIVSTDRGLCGGLNINLFRQLLKFIKEKQDQGVNVKLCLVGRKATVFFKNLSVERLAQVDSLGDKPTLNDLIGVVKVMLDAFDDGELDELYLANNSFVNTMTQSPTVERMVPVQATATEQTGAGWDYVYEPSAEELLDPVLTRYVESQVYQAAVENVACEMAARMVAMKAATDNAGDLIDGLQLDYNNARQAAITTELNEIVAGAAAV